MKLNEIIQSTIQNSTSSVPFNNDQLKHDFINSKKFESSSSGSYSNVTSSDNEWQIQKKSNWPMADVDDPFFKFVTFLMDHDLMNTNPFFPRIYNIKTEKDENGLRIYDATIEKLQPISVMSERMQTVMGNSLCDIKKSLEKINNVESYRQIFIDYGNRHKIKSEALAVLIIVIKFIMEDHNEFKEYIKNSELLEAIMSIMKFINDTNNLTVPDIKNDNFMVRQGNTGYQLILNDVVQSKKWWMS